MHIYVLCISNFAVVRNEFTVDKSYNYQCSIQKMVGQDLKQPKGIYICSKPHFLVLAFSQEKKSFE